MRWLALTSLFVLAGCPAVDVVARLPCQTDADCGNLYCVGGQCVPSSTDAGGPDAGMPGFCDGDGPVALVGDGPARLRCGGTIAETTFRFALCTCEDYMSSFTIVTDSFDSREGPYSPGGKGGSLGLNGSLTTNVSLDIGGSLWVGSDAGMRLASGTDVTVLGVLQDRGPLAGAGATARVGSDAFVGGALELAELTVGGTLHQPAGAPRTIGELQADGTATSDFDIPPPCACDDANLLDIGALVAMRRTENDNPAIGLDQGVLSDFSSPTSLRLPCGQYYLSEITGTSQASIVVTGRAAIFVDGDLALEDGASLDLQVEGDGEVDLFVDGNVSSREALVLGNADTPAKVRLYVGGTGVIDLGQGGATIAGNVYAPRAELLASGRVEVFGSVFVRRAVASAELILHYDTAVLDAGADCPEPPDGCNGCLDCRNQACNDGQCGRCTESSDCCPPLVCYQGQCLPEVF